MKLTLQAKGIPAPTLLPPHLLTHPPPCPNPLGFYLNTPPKPIRLIFHVPRPIRLILTLPPICSWTTPEISVSEYYSVRTDSLGTIPLAPLQRGHHAARHLLSPVSERLLVLSFCLSFRMPWFLHVWCFMFHVSCLMSDVRSQCLC